jgi:hypothetical protein
MDNLLSAFNTCDIYVITVSKHVRFTNVTSDYIVNVYLTNYNFQRTEGHLKAIYTLDIYPHALHVLNYINLLNLYFKQEIIC